MLERKSTFERAQTDTALLVKLFVREMCKNEWLFVAGAFYLKPLASQKGRLYHFVFLMLPESVTCFLFLSRAVEQCNVLDSILSAFSCR